MPHCLGRLRLSGTEEVGFAGAFGFGRSQSRQEKQGRRTGGTAPAKIRSFSGLNDSKACVWTGGKRDGAERRRAVPEVGGGGSQIQKYRGSVCVLPTDPVLLPSCV